MTDSRNKALALAALAILVGLILGLAIGYLLPPEQLAPPAP